MKMPSPTSHLFSQVPRATIERSSFNRSFSHKTTFDAGLLVPILLDWIVPGDTFNVRCSGFARLSTPLKPIMDNLYLDTFFFFVPYRLVWTNFVKFMGEQVNPGDSVSFVVPTFAVPFTVVANDLGDYFGLPTSATLSYASPVKVSCLPMRAYNLIWNQWFRDENLQPSVNMPTGDGPDSYGGAGGYLVKRRGKRHDYFTSCLPFLQKGPAVTLPLGTQAPVSGLGFIGTTTTPVAKGSVRTVSPLSSPGSYPFGLTVPPDVGLVVQSDSSSPTTNRPLIYADLSNATASTVNDLRQAWQVQRLYERDARGGTRYTEIVRSHFGVISPDARLQRAEYLGGGSSPIFIHPVAQTTASPAVPTNKDAQGNLAGVGTVSFQNHGFVKSFTEHGLLIGLASVRADLTYQQGIERQWFAQTKLDQYWPVLAHLGEQAVFNKEIYFQGSGNVADDQVFGYQERYAEYRYKPSRISGKFRSDVATPLDVWHLAQDFGALPTLGDTFIIDNPPIARVVAVTTEPHFIGDFYFSMKCARPMPVYGVPGMVDHF